MAGASVQLLQISLNTTPSAGALFGQLTSENEELLTELQSMETKMLEDEKLEPSAEAGLAYFDNMTAYMGLISEVQAFLSNSLISDLDQTLMGYQNSFVNALIAGVVVACICPPLVAWYGIQSRKMTLRIRNYASKISAKTHELNVEKQKTDILLHQLLPKQVAEALKAGNIIPPEQFESVTVYFGDIMGFTTLSSKSTPLQVIDLLNQLYTLFDGILEQYDCYKVETIGDGYMVVSGCPKRNYQDHSAEICTMSLNMLAALDKFYIPHMPGERLCMRIGAHTGPVATGVVGVKMPRYCLFGDTVNTAARMESSGAALRIQVSGDTEEHLEIYHKDQFTIRQRGVQEIKGKGSMKTFWVLGKTDFPFEIDLDKAEQRVHDAMYCKPAGQRHTTSVRPPHTLND